VEKENPYKPVATALRKQEGEKRTGQRKERGVIVTQTLTGGRSKRGAVGRPQNYYGKEKRGGKGGDVKKKKRLSREKGEAKIVFGGDGSHLPHRKYQKEEGQLTAVAEKGGMTGE